MLKVVSLLAAVALGGWLAIDRIEQDMVFGFDGTRVAPAAAGERRLREVIFPSGGHNLILWVAAPKPGKPVILYFHGNAGNLALRSGRFRRFLDRGYGVVAMGYRGSSGSGGRPSEVALIFDARRLFARINDYAGNAPVVIYGESLGTGVAVGMLADSRKMPAGVILEAPFTSIRDVALSAYPEMESLVDRMRAKFDSLSKAGALRAPLLVLHGDRDAVIPISQGRQLFAAAPARIKTFLTVPGGGHTDLWRSDTLPVMWRFIDRHDRP
ncbi:alpha/beta hydrolase [Marimonas lutisalis]|uniref:alpha/beta hydrolase n=1 Tax=Marimonas lutisalis TaxID=2545756 RepID=UPI0010FA47C3|nr:alpha/beta fold hydrolase [Marimonas lutisalis]